jgi:Mor family transcriptional regulator
MRFNKSFHAYMGDSLELPEREADMISRYKDGQTLVVIADVYGITRERVRQILSKHGIKGRDGGKSVTASANKVLAEAERDARMIDKYGCNAEKIREYRKKYPRAFYQFREQRRNAYDRGIKWDFSFADWMELWIDSGHYHERGRGDKYCMARIKDSGAYSVNNVHIIKNGDNIREAINIFRESGRQWGGMNRAKQTHCKRGHLLNEDNLYFYRGSRYCKECIRVRRRAYRMKRRISA